MKSSGKTPSSTLAGTGGLSGDTDHSLVLSKSGDEASFKHVTVMMAARVAQPRRKGEIHPADVAWVMGLHLPVSASGHGEGATILHTQTQHPRGVIGAGQVQSKSQLGDGRTIRLTVPEEPSSCDSRSRHSGAWSRQCQQDTRSMPFLMPSCTSSQST